jgi:hypothetical protein
MSAAFTGTTTAGAALTATQATATGTFPLLNSSGLIDVCALLEGATSAPLTPVRNGGVWVPGCVNLDGLHPNSNGYLTLKPLPDALFQARC